MCEVYSRPYRGRRRRRCARVLKEENEGQREEGPWGGDGDEDRSRHTDGNLWRNAPILAQWVP